MNEQMIERIAEAIHDFLDERFPDGAMPGGRQVFADDHLDAEFKHEAGCEALARAAHSVMAGKVAELEAALEAISSGEAFRIQRFAEDDDPEYFLRVQRYVQQIARAALARHRGTDQL